jgi:hypothetical protein
VVSSEDFVFGVTTAKWREMVTAKAANFETGIMRAARVRELRETHRLRTWLAYKLAPWLY